jgi:hypothetical protein
MQDARRPINRPEDRSRQGQDPRLTDEAWTKKPSGNSATPSSTGDPSIASGIAGHRGRNRNMTTNIKAPGVAGTITTLTFDRDRDLLTLNLADQQGAPLAELQLTTASAKDLRVISPLISSFN